MATYAIGDVQGCYAPLQRLLDRVGFSPARDRLWFVGDLVNRGPDSLAVLRFVRGLGERAVTVLGNHDIHLVMQHEGFERRREDDSFEDVLRAPDAADLVAWVRQQPLFHQDGRHAMVHAGLLPQWSFAQAAGLAREVERAFRGPGYREFLAHLYGSKPERWEESLGGWDRLRVIVNAMTRMRFCKPDGTMEFHSDGVTPPPGFVPWYEARAASDALLIFGHWSARGLTLRPDLAGLDTGCVWGRSLSALRLEDRWLAQVPCTDCNGGTKG